MGEAVEGEIWQKALRKRKPFGLFVVILYGSIGPALGIGVDEWKRGTSPHTEAQASWLSKRLGLPPQPE